MTLKQWTARCKFGVQHFFQNDKSVIATEQIFSHHFNIGWNGVVRNEEYYEKELRKLSKTCLDTVGQYH